MLESILPILEIGAIGTTLAGFLAWLARSVIQLRAEVAVLQSQHVTYLRALERLEETLDKLSEREQWDNQ